MAASSAFSARLAWVAKNSDLMVGLGLVGVLGIMIVPLPPVILDSLLAVNITLSLLVIMVAIYLTRILEFSAFPSLLLIATLFRLSLNVASTRLILLHGHEGPTAAGQVIKSFGGFVVGGNYVIGIIIFLILVLVNFIVITKGAGRVAEVAARFTLDAMPGKQMAIDADLNAGLINETSARERRRVVEMEADFYGAMDGASKFVRGDAIAGILITAINIIGGLLIGILQRNMALGDALQNYTMLTVGDGLVSQIPALIVSTAAGVIVTRVAQESNLGEDLSGQLFPNPRAVALASFILFGMAIMPGLPFLPFFLMGSLTGGMAYFMPKKEETEVKQAEREMTPAEREGAALEQMLALDALELEVGYGLISLVDAKQDGELLERIKMIRKQFAKDKGIIIPQIHIRDNLQLKQSSYRIVLKGIPIGEGELMLKHWLAMKPTAGGGEIDGMPANEPIFGLPAVWISDKDKDKAIRLGYTVVNNATIVATHLSETIKQNAHELLGRTELQELLDFVRRDCPRLVEELIPDPLPLGVALRVLRNLLKEGLSIRNLQGILEVLSENAYKTKDPDVLSETVRVAMSKGLIQGLRGPDGAVRVMMLEPAMEEELLRSVQSTDTGLSLAPAPQTAKRLVASLEREGQKMIDQSYTPILVCSPRIRLPLKRAVEKMMPMLVVVSHAELDASVPVITTSVVG